MAALLDVVELMVLEGCKDQAERDKIIWQLYRPTNDDERPAGFSPEEQRESLNAFLGTDGLAGMM